METSNGINIKFIAGRINLKSGGGSHQTLDLKIKYFMSRGHRVSLTTLFSTKNHLIEKQLL